MFVSCNCFAKAIHAINEAQKNPFSSNLLNPTPSEHFEQPTDDSDGWQPVASRSYILNERKIIVIYHCEHEALLRQDLYHKDDITKTVSNGIELIKCENATISAVKILNKEMIELRESHYGQETNQNSNLLILQPGEMKTKSLSHPTGDYADKESKGTIDYLSPYMLQVDKQDSCLSKEDALKVKHACLQGLKERLLERANIMQSRLDKEKEKLARKQEAFQNEIMGRTVDEQEALLKMYEDARFRITVLQKRLNEHEDKAIQKYKTLEAKLNADHRLASLHESV